MVDILEAKLLTEMSLMLIPGVQGVGLGSSSEKKIVVYVEKMTSEILEKVPKLIGGFPVKVVKSGRFKALSLLESITLKEASNPLRTSKVRPAMGGISIGHYLITAGTLGGVFDGLILSNNHVLANSSTLEHPRADIGDPILQPGNYDGGTIEDQIASLHSYVPLKENEYNLVDVAWAEPLNPTWVSEEILDVGFTEEYAEPTVDLDIQKSGRTSGVTFGKIIDVNATVTVEYGSIQLKFMDQVVTTGILSPGDSGSLGLDMNKNIWGLGFAGSDDLSVFNKIRNVMAPPPPAPAQAGLTLSQLIGLSAIGFFLVGRGPS